MMGSFLRLELNEVHEYTTVVARTMKRRYGRESETTKLDRGNKSYANNVILEDDAIVCRIKLQHSINE
jgi:hypothetical protein